MSEMRQQAPTSANTRIPKQRGGEAPPEATGWAGLLLFGAMMMILLGSFQSIAGLMALFDEGYYVVGPNGLAVDVDYTTWGWVHLSLGLIAMAAGGGLFTGRLWARVLAIAVATISAIVNFAFLAAFPLWAVLMITLDVLVIYAIAAHGKELQDQR